MGDFQSEIFPTKVKAENAPRTFIAKTFMNLFCKEFNYNV